jgi:hypothetical protein
LLFLSRAIFIGVLDPLLGVVLPPFGDALLAIRDTKQRASVAAEHLLGQLVLLVLLVVTDVLLENKLGVGLSLL